MCDLFPNVDPNHPPVRDTRMDPEDQIVVGAQVCIRPTKIDDEEYEYYQEHPDEAAADGYSGPEHGPEQVQRGRVLRIVPFNPRIHDYQYYTIQNDTIDTSMDYPWFDVVLFEADKPKQKSRGVRNARLVGEYAKLPHGVESLIASNLSGIEGKNAAQQGDILAKRTGIDRKGYSGGRRRTRGRKTRRKTSRHKRI